MTRYTQGKPVRKLFLQDWNLTGNKLNSLKGGGITKLILERCKLDKDSLKIIGKITSLKRLSIVNSEVSTEILRPLKGSSLTSICLNECTFSDGSMKELAVPECVIELFLQDCKISRQAIKQLPNFPLLKNLVIAGSTVERVDVKVLKDILALEELHVKEIASDLLTTLKKSKIKRLVVLTNDNITDNDLLPAAKIKSLEELRITWCKNISPDFKEKFSQLNKKCKLTIKTNQANLVEPYEILFQDKETSENGK